MKKLTFAFDVQLNDQEDFIAAGTQVEVSDNPLYLNRHNDFTPVIITSAYNYNGKTIKINQITEWFSNNSFIELRIAHF
jgi:hypothetical protein